MSLGTWGPVTFEASADVLRTWRDAERSGGARWAEHEVIAAKPVTEFIGPGLDTISLSVRLDLERGIVPRDELRQLREQRDLGANHDLIIGGELVGTFTLRELDEEWTRFDSRGVLRLAVVKLSLKEYA